MKSCFYYLSFFLVLFLSNTSAQWVQVNGPAGGQVHSLTAAGNYVFACAGNGNIYRSSDYGDNWEELNKLPMRAHTRFLSSHENIIFAFSYQLEIYRSTDLGNEWLQCDYDKGARCFAYMDSTIFIATQTDGIYKSPNNGISFTKVNDLNVSFIAVKDSLLFSVRDGDGMVYVSSDRGNTWVLSFTTDHPYIQNLCVLGEYIFVGGVKLYRSSDNGTTWSVLSINGSLNVAGEFIFVANNLGIKKSSDYGITWVPASFGINSYGGIKIIKSGNTFFAGNRDEGIFRSFDNGNHWVECNKDIFSTTISSFCKSPSGLWCSVPGKGIYRSSNSGTDWILVRYLPESRSSIIEFQNKILYTANQKIYATTDNGNTWSVFSTVSGFRESFWKLAVKDNILFAEIRTDVTSWVSYTTDSGVSWQNTWDGSHVTTWASNGNYMFAAFENEYPPYHDKICRLDEEDWTWKQLNNGFQTPNTKTVAISGSDIFAGSLDAGVYISENNGELWRQVSYPFPTHGSKVFSVNDHFVLSNSFKGSFYFPEELRILLYEKSTAAWKDVTQSFVEPDITATVVDGGNLFAGLKGDGIWMLPLSPVTSSEVKTLPGKNALEQNYPNPFNPSTVISYSITGPGMVKLKIYNTLGELMATLINEQKDTGSYQVTFDAKELPSGTYFYRLEAGNTIIARKMLLIK